MLVYFISLVYKFLKVASIVGLGKFLLSIQLLSFDNLLYNFDLLSHRRGANACLSSILCGIRSLYQDCPL